MTKISTAKLYALYTESPTIYSKMLNLKHYAIAALLVSLTLVGSAGASPNQSTTLTIDSYYSNGPQIHGMFVELQNANGQDLKTGYTPITFNVTPGKDYYVYADSWQQITFQFWSQPQNPATNPIEMSFASGVHFTLIAFYGGYSGNTSTTTSSSSASDPMGLVVPLYMYPDSYWTQLIQAKEANPTVPVIAVVNPSNGPGSSPDSNYVTGIKDLQAAGITVLGYVDSQYQGTPITTAERQVADYANWYGTNGIFEDCMTNTGSPSYYSTLTQYRGLGRPVLHHGQPRHEHHGRLRLQRGQPGDLRGLWRSIARDGPGIHHLRQPGELLSDGLLRFAPVAELHGFARRTCGLRLVHGPGRQLHESAIFELSER